LDPAADVVAARQAFSHRQKAAPTSARALFTPDQRFITLTLWLLFFVSQFEIYLLSSWVPSLLNALGHSMTISGAGISTFAGGAVTGGLLWGYLCTKFRPTLVVTTAYVVGTVAIALITLFPTSAVALLILVGFAGLGHSGAALCINALTTERYPPEIRATGFGWAISVGRAGSVVSPLVAGALLANGWTPIQIFQFCLIPPIISLGTLLMLARLDIVRTRNLSARSYQT
jgi:MFS transporter, AAHS family, 4-hydroxybenzoate transporter